MKKIKIYLNDIEVKKILARRNKNLKWFASQMSVSCSYISAWLSGQKCPRPEKREKIQQVFGNNLSWETLFRISETNTSKN